eukprot:CCRYP_019480-RA/>CCRYP_019480-RA protein AED:0.27 eAED:0.27 QI:0/-1/0/1/-1/0/1/0/75
MSISPAPPWETILYALHESSFVPNWSQQNLVFYKRFINNVFDIWLFDPHTHLNMELWRQFIDEMQHWHGCLGVDM